MVLMQTADEGLLPETIVQPIFQFYPPTCKMVLTNFGSLVLIILNFRLWSPFRRHQSHPIINICLQSFPVICFCLTVKMHATCWCMHKNVLTKGKIKYLQQNRSSPLCMLINTRHNQVPFNTEIQLFFNSACQFISNNNNVSNRELQNALCDTVTSF